MIELEPFGMTPGMDGGRPVMLFRQKDGDATLPVWLSPLDAGVALGQRGTRLSGASPHDVSLNILNAIGLRVESCRFADVRGHQQYVELTFRGSRRLKTLKFRADHAVSFCLQARAKFYCTREYIEKCRDVDASLDRFAPALNSKGGARKSGIKYLN